MKKAIWISPQGGFVPNVGLMEQGKEFSGEDKTVDSLVAQGRAELVTSKQSKKVLTEDKGE